MSTNGPDLSVRTSLPEHIRQLVEMDVLTGALPPNTRVTEEQLSSRYSVSRTPVPLSSIAWRAAATRSTASAKSHNGCSGFWLESSTESPATPVPQARVTWACTSLGSTA